MEDIKPYIVVVSARKLIYGGSGYAKENIEKFLGFSFKTPLSQLE
jgi:hypothetical protein